MWCETVRVVIIDWLRFTIYIEEIKRNNNKQQQQLISVAPSTAAVLLPEPAVSASRRLSPLGEDNGEETAATFRDEGTPSRALPLLLRHDPAE